MYRYNGMNRYNISFSKDGKLYNISSTVLTALEWGGWWQFGIAAGCAAAYEESRHEQRCKRSGVARLANTGQMTQRLIHATPGFSAGVTVRNASCSCAVLSISIQAGFCELDMSLTAIGFDAKVPLEASSDASLKQKPDSISDSSESTGLL